MRKSWIAAVALLMLAGSCHGSKSARRGADVRPMEAWDSRNAPVVFGNLQSMRYQDMVRDELRQGVLAKLPWSDDYWPWIQVGLAKRWLLPEKAFDVEVDAPDYEQEVQEEIAAFLGVARTAGDDTRWRLSPMEKYDLLASDGFPLTTKELLHHARYKQYFEEKNIPWKWMGSCDGWAVAALQLPPPRYPVLASMDGGAPILFTVGDVRGLVSKAYTDNAKSKEMQIIGTRCEQGPQEISRDDNGRIVDGTLGQWSDGALAGERNIQIVYNNWRLSGYEELGSSESVIVFRYLDEPSELYWLRGVAWTDRLNDVVRVEVRPMSSGQLDPSVALVEADFKYLKSCRDLNAGAFHIVLARYLSRAAAAEHGEARGFALEVSRTDEVWNQPIYAYMTRLGEPVDLAAVPAGGPQDPYQGYRAPGTRFLVHVYTTVIFGQEHGPLVFYDQDDEWLARTTYQYILELDADGYIIGGEWHQAVPETADELTPLSGTALLASLGEQIAYGQQVSSPDFIWRYPEDTRLLERCREPPCLSAQVVYRLAACSRETPQGGNTVELQGRTLPFVRCAIEPL